MKRSKPKNANLNISRFSGERILKSLIREQETSRLIIVTVSESQIQVGNPYRLTVENRDSLHVFPHNEFKTDNQRMRGNE